MLLERGIRDILRVLLLASNTVYSARSVEDAIRQKILLEKYGYRSLIFFFIQALIQISNIKILLEKYCYRSLIFFLSKH